MKNTHTTISTRYQVQQAVHTEVQRHSGRDCPDTWRKFADNSGTYTGIRYSRIPRNTEPKYRHSLWWNAGEYWKNIAVVFEGRYFIKYQPGFCRSGYPTLNTGPYNHTMPTTTRQRQKERKCYVLILRVISFGSKNTDFSLDTPRGWSGSRWWVGVGLGWSGLRNNENKENGNMLSISRSTTVSREVAVSPLEKSQLCQAHNTKTKIATRYVR